MADSEGTNEMRMRVMTAKIKTSLPKGAQGLRGLAEMMERSRSSRVKGLIIAV